jgi:SAM-dependent methyltransferase
MGGSNEEQFEFWEELTPGWLLSEGHTELVATAFGVAAMDSLALTPGQRVIDIGCGLGSTTVALAGIVGPGGEAVGIDIAPAMIEVARNRASAEGVANATFVAADAQTDALGESAYDAAYSRFGSMFFSDPTAAFANVHASLRAGGALGLACWSNIFANEWMFVPGSAVVAVTGALPPMPAPGDPGPFSLEDPDVVTALLRGTGFGQIDVKPMVESIVIPTDQIESLVALSRRVGPVREALRTADDETAARIEAGVRAALTDRVENGELRLSASALIISARA